MSDLLIPFENLPEAEVYTEEDIVGALLVGSSIASEFNLHFRRVTFAGIHVGFDDDDRFQITVSAIQNGSIPGRGLQAIRAMERAAVKAAKAVHCSRVRITAKTISNERFLKCLLARKYQMEATASEDMLAAHRGLKEATGFEILEFSDDQLRNGLGCSLTRDFLVTM